MDIRVTSSDFSGLTDAYTGAPMDVVMRVAATGPLFVAPKATSPRDYCDSGTPPDVCPYTGEPFVARVIGGKTFLLGGFDPRVPRTREAFLYYATMRGGVSRLPAPDAPRAEAPVRRGRVTKRHRTHADRRTPSLSDFHIHAVEKSLSRFKDYIPASPTVSMYTGRGS